MVAPLNQIGEPEPIHGKSVNRYTNQMKSKSLQSGTRVFIYMNYKSDAFKKARKIWD